MPFGSDSVDACPDGEAGRFAVVSTDFTIGEAYLDALPFNRRRIVGVPDDDRRSVLDCNPNTVIAVSCASIIVGIPAVLANRTEAAAWGTPSRLVPS